MLTLTNLRKSFGTRIAVDGVSISIRKGEVFGLLGPNGAGKSTTIGMCIGVLAPDGGSVELDGSGPPTLASVRKHIGVAPQSLAIYDELSGRENVEFFGQIQGLSGSTLKQRVSHVLELVGLSDRAKDRTGGYSGGMKRRLNLAAAIVHDPALVLLDEPTAGVDPQSRNNILDMVKQLAAAGKTVVYTTHYMEEAQKLCDRVAIIDQGKVLALGTVHELVASHGGESIVTVVRGAGEESKEEVVRTNDPVSEISRALASGGVTGVRIDRPDLETVFLSLTGRRLRD